MNEAELFPSRRMTVLLVDDQAAIIEAVRRMLSTEPDVDFHFCRNPIQAIKMANQIAPTVILQDLIMPEIDGLTLVRYFRANQATRDVPLIVLSVNEEATTKAEAFALGANDYMVKFPDRVEVIARLRYHSRGYINLLERNDAHERLKIAMKHEQQRAQEFAVLNEMSAKLQTCASEADTFPLIARAYQQLFPNSVGSVNLLDLGGETVRVAVAWGHAAFEPQDFKKQACRALTQGHGHVTMPDGTGDRCAHLPDALAQASCCIPMLAQGEPMGVIVLQCGEIQQMRSVENLTDTAAFRLADHYALSFANLRLREQLKIEAIHDPLTGLYNRRYMEERLKREMLRAERHHSAVGVIMLDIDHFKRFNDQYGHETGDAVLQALSAYLLGNIRAEDIACRYGGEEMLLIMPDIEFHDLQSRAEFLCAGLKRALSLQRDAKPLAVTASFGVASYPTHGATPKEVLKAADSALYQAKAAGRDRVVAALPPSIG